MISMEDFKKLVPTAVALFCFTIVNLISNSSFKSFSKVQFQSSVFALFFVFPLAYLVSTDQSKLEAFWKSFSDLSDEMRFVISFIVISGSYFGAAMYVASPKLNAVNHSNPAACDSVIDFVVPSKLPEDDKELFEKIFDRLVKEIIDDLPTVYEMPSEAVAWIQDMINYTVAGGKMNRGLALMAVQKFFCESEGGKLSNKERCQSAALGWCIEFLQAFFLVADDVMDGSKTRRGQPCWYLRPNVGLIAINDSFILETCVFKILKRYFGKEKFYPQLLDLFIEVTRQTEFGQLLDLTSQVPGTIDLSRFTMERYKSIVIYKTAFYSFYLPIALGMIVAGVEDPQLFKKAREITLIMGEYFQIQDDYLDCYGKPEVIGKIGTDIKDNKCSWLVVQALNLVNAKQKKILEVNYGQEGDSNEEKVKALYRELDLEKVYKKYEEESYCKIRELIDDISGMPTGGFEFLLKKIYKRSK